MWPHDCDPCRREPTHPSTEQRWKTRQQWPQTICHIISAFVSYYLCCAEFMNRSARNVKRHQNKVPGHQFFDIMLRTWMLWAWTDESLEPLNTRSLTTWKQQEEQPPFVFYATALTWRICSCGDIWANDSIISHIFLDIITFSNISKIFTFCFTWRKIIKESRLSVLMASPSYRVQFWCDPPACAEAAHSWRLARWWCCRKSRPAALGGRPPGLYPGSSRLAGHGTQTHLAASESDEREGSLWRSCQKMTWS